MIQLKYILLTLFSIVSTLSVAQETMNVQWSKWYDHESTVTPKAYFGNDSSGYYGVLETYGYSVNMKRKEQSRAFFKLNLKGEFVFTKKINLKYKEEVVEASGFYTIGGNYFLFSDLLSKDEKTVTILVYAIDKKGNVTASPIELLTLPTFEGGYYDYECYQDKDSTAFIIRSPNGENLKKMAFRLYAFDTELNALWSKDFNLPSDEYYRPPLQIALGKNKLFILGQIARDLEVKRPMTCKLSFYDLKTNQESHETIKLMSGNVASGYLYVDEQDNPIVTGFYVKEMRFKYDSKLLDGFYCMKYDAESHKEIFNTQKEFPYEVLTEFMPEKKAKSGGPFLSELGVKSINSREDGSIYIVSEHSSDDTFGRNYMHTTNYGPAGSRITTGYSQHTYYTYQNLIVMSISKEGSIEWFKTIPKPKQSSIQIDNVRFFSYIMGSEKDEVFFIYNENYDNPNRLKTIDHAGLINCNDVITTLATLDRKGNLTRQTIFKEDNLKHKTCIEPVNTLKLTENTFILYRTSDHNAKVGLLKFRK